MNPDIFLDDFEITENTQELHAILGRCMIVATHFDQLCERTSKYLELKNSFAILTDSQVFQSYTIELTSKFRALSNSIDSLPINNDLKATLHEARKARNEIVHDLAIGLTGCLEKNIDESNFKSQLARLIQDVTAGDYAISMILSLFNHEPVLQQSSAEYQDKVLKWVLGE
ncbi:hypothetical protein [Vibrio coralliilyticus]|uniref:hypothetical protein n=1 Tax=Vibrio coralliilyticus TaxID=190893 RepID=UPI00148DE077|nr:hypothetical protein [Vibrio coralliilyticus]NOI30318.1 hypothetical protein [Vibrio coralliilyticus]NOI49907.1 hypothetical protein [Vibrio coralliilyticus]